MGKKTENEISYTRESGQQRGRNDWHFGHFALTLNFVFIVLQFNTGQNHLTLASCVQVLGMRLH